MKDDPRIQGRICEFQGKEITEEKFLTVLRKQEHNKLFDKNRREIFVKNKDLAQNQHIEMDFISKNINNEEKIKEYIFSNLKLDNPHLIYFLNYLNHYSNKPSSEETSNGINIIFSIFDNNFY